MCKYTYLLLFSYFRLRFIRLTSLCAWVRLLLHIMRIVLRFRLQSRHLFTERFLCHPTPQSVLYQSRPGWLISVLIACLFSTVLHSWYSFLMFGWDTLPLRLTVLPLRQKHQPKILQIHSKLHHAIFLSFYHWFWLWYFRMIPVRLQWWQFRYFASEPGSLCGAISLKRQMFAEWIVWGSLISQRKSF